MKWPVRSKSAKRKETPFFNLMYLHAPGQGGPDPTISWTTEMPWKPVQAYLKRRNDRGHVMIGTTHLLIQAVAHALALHPELNRRVVGRRVHSFRDRNVCLATRQPGNNEVNLIMIYKADQTPLARIAHLVWHYQLEYRRKENPVVRDRDRLRRLPSWFFRTSLRLFQWTENLFPMPIFGRVDRFRSSPVLINDFSHSRFPTMRAYKPSRMPDESKSLSVTLGPREQKVIWQNGQPKPMNVSPLCVRGDHRICDGYQLSLFVTTLLRLLANPAAMEKEITGVPSIKGTNQRNSNVKAA